MEPKINYVALLILIILGVAIGNLTSSLIATKYFNIKPQETVKQSEPKAPAVTTVIEPKPAEPSKPQTNETDIARETVKLSPEPDAASNNKPGAADSSVDPKKLIEQRKLDENGVKLAKRCKEWTVVHKDMNTPSSERGMNKHCSEYYDYLSFGTLPDAN